MSSPRLHDAVTDTVDISGTCDGRFSRVRDVLATQLASGADIGASAAVFIDGEPVVDIWGGHVDAARTRPWERDTIVNTFSTVESTRWTRRMELML